jgi:hypothetical protein
LFDKGDVPPRVGTERAGVVERHAEEIEPVLGYVVPLLAGDLAGFASDADGGVGKEADPLRMVDVARVSRHIIQRAV